MPDICGILLAAGQSLRFGQNKLLQPLPDGTPLLTQTVNNMHPGVDRLIVVVPPQHAPLAEILDTDRVEMIINNAASDGMGSSLACGVAASLEADGWIIGLADMPWIPSSIIKRVASALHEGWPLVAPRYQQQRGHPVGFHHRFAPELLTLQSDQGARSVLQQHQSEIHFIDCQEPGILLDIDTPDDLHHPTAAD